MQVTRKNTAGTQPKVRKAPYHSPRLKEHGDVALLTSKPGTRGDGAMGTTGDKGQGS